MAAYQHPNGAGINWGKVARSGISFAAVKATEGTYYRNPYALSDIKAARAAGLSVGASSVFAIPNGNGGRGADPVRQADFFAGLPGAARRHRAGHAGHRVQPVLRRAVLRAGREPRMVTWVARFSAEVQAKTGRVPYIYTPQGWWNPCTGGSATLHKDPLWVPNYTTAASQAMPFGWTTSAVFEQSLPGWHGGRDSGPSGSPTWTGCSAASPRWTLTGGPG